MKRDLNGSANSLDLSACQHCNWSTISPIKHPCIITQVVYFLLQVSLLLFLFLRAVVNTIHSFIHSFIFLGSSHVYLGEFSYLYLFPRKTNVFGGILESACQSVRPKRFNPFQSTVNLLRRFFFFFFSGGGEY